MNGEKTKATGAGVIRERETAPVKRNFHRRPFGRRCSFIRSSYYPKYPVFGRPQ